MELDPRVEKLLAGAPAGIEREVIEGELFTSALPTPYLAEAIGRAADAVRDGFERAGRAVSLVSQEHVALGPLTAVRPDVLARDAATEALLVMVEVRTESSDRYALGPKRMAYARAGVPEYWFVDPRAERVVALRLVEGEPDYPWPGAELGPGDAISSEAVPNLSVAVRDLLGSGTWRSQPAVAAS